MVGTDKVVEREYPRKCPECGSKNIATKNGKAYCADCGLVIKENIVDLGPEWRSFDTKEGLKKIRVGAPMTHRIHDKGLGTLISQSGLKRMEKRAHVTGVVEQNLIFALSEISRMAYQLGLKIDMKEEASFMFRKLKKEKLAGKKSIESVTSAILYIICRLDRAPRTFEEVEKVSWIDEAEIKKAYKLLSEKLNLKIPPVFPSDFVPRFCSLLNLNGKIKIEALEITGKITSGKLISRQSPIVTAAVAINIAAELNQNPRTFREIADVAGIMDSAIISKGSKEISKQLGTLNIPN